MRTTRILISLIVAFSGCLLGAVVWEGGPDAVIFPPQEIPVHFTHAYHVKKPNKRKRTEGEGLACTFCHENISTSSSSADRDIPGHGSCDTCHGEWIGEEGAPAANELCAKCHLDLAGKPVGTIPAKLSIPQPNIKFAHGQHLDAKIACVQCHNNVPKKSVATRDDYPTMDRCIACHQERGVSTECKTCHFTLPSGRVQIEYQEGKLAPNRLHSFAIHDADFLRDHAVPAKRDKAYCANCHGEDFCLTCHDGVARDVRYHPGDWLSVHPIRAKQDEPRCQSCHRLQSFCFDCHVRSGVASAGIPSDPFQHRTVRGTTNASGAFTPTGPHPMAEQGWLSPSSRNFHGFFAQRNIRSCASCHQEQFCVSCHFSSASGAAARPPPNARVLYGGNPHGPNPQRLKGSTARIRNARMCLKCHSPQDPNWR